MKKIKKNLTFILQRYFISIGIECIKQYEQLHGEILNILLGCWHHSLPHSYFGFKCTVPNFHTPFTLNRAFDINIRLYDLDILFGIPFEEDMFIIINFCILYGKKYIYDCQINDETVSIDRFKTKLKNRLEVEIYIMDSNNLCLDVKKILLVELYDSLCA